MTVQGRIIRGIAGFYYVYVREYGIFECKARGVFRNRSEKPLVGDMVEMTIISREAMEGNIESILDRHSSLVRPAVANIDQALVIFAALDPPVNLNLLDRFLCEMELKNVPSVIIFNKKDLITESEGERLAGIYERAGYRVLLTSTLEGSDSGDRIKEVLKGKVTAVAGPSGAGKSSIVNMISGGMLMETGGISKKLGRGRHTTRRAELIEVKNLEDTFIVDTPGFSSFSVAECECRELQGLFPEIGRHEGECFFTGCSHINEKECAVKEALRLGEIAETRYESYVSFWEEIKGRRKYK